MSCTTIALRTQLLPDHPSGGSWVYDGYHASDPEGTPGAGGTDPGTLTGDNPAIDFAGFIAGYYFFTYTSEEETCVAPKQVVVWIQERLSAGTPVDIDLCLVFDGIFDLNDSLIDPDLGGVWTLNPDSPDDPGAAFVAPNLDVEELSGSGVFIFDYTVDVIEENDFEAVDCILCRSIATVTITVFDECDAGVNTIINDPVGSFNLFDYLDGTPDIGGTWEQNSGDPVDISEDYLGTVNLNAATGCEFVFEYKCPAPRGCQTTAEITVLKNPEFSVAITRNGETLESDISGCAGTVTYQWQKQVSGTWTNIIGANASTFTGLEDETLYRLIAECDGCPKISNEIFVEFECDCENIGVGLSLNSSTDCLTLSPTGEECTFISTDVIQYKRKTSGTWLNYNSPVCGCDLREFLNVNPTCGISGNNLQLGFNNVQKCLGTVDRVFIKWGNNTVQTFVGNFNTGFVHQVSASDMVNLYNRTAEFRIRLNVNGVFLFQIININYTGGTSNPLCSQVTMTKANFPKYYYPLDIRRTINFSNGCPQVQIQTDWDINECDMLFVQLTTGNVNGSPAVVASVFNDTGCNFGFTYVWYRNGVLLAGETGFFVNRTIHGEGFYEVIVTCGECEATDSIQTNACTMTVSVSGPSGGTYTATVNNCAGSKTYYWERWNGTTWVNVRTQTTTSNTDPYTPSQNGQYRVRVICAADNCENQAIFDHFVECTASVVITEDSGILTATPSNCPATITYAWARWNGTGWTPVGTNSSTYTPTQSGLYRVQITCGDGCFAEDQIPFVISCSLTVVVTLPPVGGTYTATASGCSGSRTWQWQRWNGTTWITEQEQTNSNTTNTYTPTLFGLYRVRVTCIGDGCVATDVFEHTDCAASVTIVQNGNLLTAITSGCTGSIIYTWYHRVTPGSGSWGSPIANSQTINTNTWGSGEYRVVVLCNGCETEAVFTYQPCPHTVTVNCANSNPYTAVVSGCAGAVTYQWQYSLTGTGWVNLGTAQTQMPVNGEGFYRVITWCDGVCPKSFTCFYENPCSGSATITPNYNGCDWEIWLFATGSTQNIDLYLNNTGIPEISGSYNLGNSTGRNALKADIESWLLSNGGGSVIVTYDRGEAYLKISCTTAVLDYLIIDGGTYFAGMCARECDYTFSVNSTTYPHFHYIVINGVFSENAFTPLLFSSQSAAIKTRIENLLTSLGLSGTVTVNTNGTITIAGSEGSISIVVVSATGINPLTTVHAARSGCDPGFFYPTLNLDVVGCTGSQTITWQYRPVPGSGAWTNVQTGGTSYFNCTSGEYRARVVCGGCTYFSNQVTI